ncbi:hypothetical protein Ancab_003689 [Ancistrocladus abbreviatus]
MQQHQVEGQMAMISQLYPPGLCTQVPLQRGEPKPRRRRRKSKNEGNDAVAAKKRKLSEEQVNMLERSFGCEHKLESERKERLASELGLDPRQVAVWFQNKRARWKNKKLEGEYSKLSAEHEGVVIEKCRLEAELLKLKEQLNDAQSEIQRLIERSDNGSSNSPSSSLTMEAMDPQLLGEFAFENMFYAAENAYVAGMEWANLYSL